MNFNVYLRKPKTLGEGLKRVKNTFGVVGENTSKTLGTRDYKCYGGKYDLNIQSTGKKEDSFLSVDVLENGHKIGKEMLGKISNFFKHYTKELLYSEGYYGVAHKRRTVIQNFGKDKSGNIFPGFITKVKHDYILLEKNHINDR